MGIKKKEIVWKLDQITLKFLEKDETRIIYVFFFSLSNILSVSICVHWHLNEYMEIGWENRVLSTKASKKCKILNKKSSN